MKHTLHIHVNSKSMNKMIKYQNIISYNKHTLFKYFSVNMVNIVIPLVDFL